MEVREYETHPAPNKVESYATVYFRYTTKAFEDERQIYGLLAFLSDVGGFIQCFVILGYWLVSDSTKNKYFSKLLNKMYHVKREESNQYNPDDLNYTMSLKDLHRSYS
jgi:hypothetical protein